MSNHVFRDFLERMQFICLSYKIVIAYASEDYHGAVCERDAQEI